MTEQELNEIVSRNRRIWERFENGTMIASDIPDIELLANEIRQLHGLEADNLEAELCRLAEFIEERFPAEAASADLADSSEVVGLAKQLLERLWRWEH